MGKLGVPKSMEMIKTSKKTKNKTLMYTQMRTRLDYGEGASQLSHSRQRGTEEALEKTA